MCGLLRLWGELWAICWLSSHSNMLEMLLLRKHTTQDYCFGWIWFWTLNYSIFLFCWSSEGDSHVVIAPQSPVLEMGTNFTATCMIIDTTEITADDLYWNLCGTTVSKEQYTKINRTALSVTIPVTREKCEWLFCLCEKKSAHVVLNQGRFMHGIYLTKGCKFFSSQLKTYGCFLTTCI